MHILRSARSTEGQRGQALVEFAVTLPLLASAIMGVFEFGVAVAANIGVNRAAQNGAHMASSAGNIAGADCIVLDEIERSVLPPNDRGGISTVRIELTDLDGDEVAASNTWQRTGSTECAIATGITLTVPYTLLAGGTYPDTQRCNILAGCPTMTPTRTTVDNIAVAIDYTHDWVTPLGSILPLGGGSGWTFEQRNVFRMEPHRLRRSPDRQRGQGLVEFALVLPVVLLLIAGVIEIGLLGNDAITIGYGSREGARAGSALGRGGVRDCSTGNDPAGVDQAIVAGVQRIIESSGSDVDLSDITAIHIFKATSTGAKVDDRTNTWTYAGINGGPDIDPGPLESKLEFRSVTTEWPACTRQNGATPDIIGVEVVYDRELSSPLAAILRGLGVHPVVGLAETTVMTLNPTY